MNDAERYRYAPPPCAWCDIGLHDPASCWVRLKWLREKEGQRDA